MITPDDRLPLDDSENEDTEQLSQQDIHSNGFDDNAEHEDDTVDIDALDQAYDASEPSYTLNLDDDNTDDDE